MSRYRMNRFWEKLKGLQTYWHGRPLDRRPYAALRHIHLRRFPSADPDRFTRLWCEIAALCDRAPLEMHEEDRLLDLNPRPSRWSLDFGGHPRLENLYALIVNESRGRRAPKPQFETIGEVLDYLLISDSGDPIKDSRPSSGASRASIYRR